MAAIMAERPWIRSAVITTTGAIMYQPCFMSWLTTGRWSFGTPRRPCFRASKWTLVKIPVKYRSAGIQAARAIVP